MKNKFFLLVVVALLAVGCARGEQPDWGEGGKNLYITTTWQEISPSYVYYVAISTDSGLIPDSDPDRWNEFYVVKWEDHNFFLRKPGGSFSYFSSPSVSGQEMVVTLSLVDDLGNPDIIRVMVVSTDKGGNVEDFLDEVATFRLKQQSSEPPIYDLAGDADAAADLLSLKIEVR
ncbi:hypothetical protein [Candidatus Sordicultor fermentans]|uniref:hypothetical protein n=1 Tax=Candidatus Sordicultor fermentans TaxID=1953203 RepID=UPI0016944EE1|nr:hypothetical protein [Candidatus Atribacteria bacterium]